MNPPVSWIRFAIVLAVCTVCSLGAEPPAESPPHVRILFLGNSYTAQNQLPSMVGELLLSSKLLAPHISSYLRGSFKLEEHAVDQTALDLLKKGADDGQPWDVLVVQEQSIVSAVAAYQPQVAQLMNTGLTKLVAAAREVNPQMLIVDFQVWARHEKLWREKSADALLTGSSPEEAHTRIHRANVNAVNAALEKNPGAQMLISPVGDFWWLVHDLYPALALYAEDGTHPATLGTLLGAYVIAGTIGGRAAIEQASWIPPDCPPTQVARVKKMLLDHPEVFKAAGK